MHQERGSSLVEVLVAATITVIALTSLAQVIVIAVAANQRAKSHTMATILAQEKMEQLMSDQAVTSGSDYIDSHGASLGDPSGAEFVRRWIAQASPGDPGSFVLEVSVVIPRSNAVAAARLVGFKTSSLQ
jgi:type II secretory pathway pseudopilin PulG